jgi:hypothetical protein
MVLHLLLLLCIFHQALACGHALAWNNVPQSSVPITLFLKSTT